MVVTVRGPVYAMHAAPRARGRGGPAGHTSRPRKPPHTPCHQGLGQAHQAQSAGCVPYARCIAAQQQPEFTRRVLPGPATGAQAVAGSQARVCRQGTAHGWSCARAGMTGSQGAQARALPGRVFISVWRSVYLPISYTLPPYQDSLHCAPGCPASVTQYPQERATGFQFVGAIFQCLCTEGQVSVCPPTAEVGDRKPMTESSDRPNTLFVAYTSDYGSISGPIAVIGLCLDVPQGT